MQRRRHSAEFKAKVALAAIKGDKTLNELAKDFEILPNQIITWKKQLLEGVNDVFSSNRERKAAENEADKSALYQQIGQLKVELDWLKKKSGSVR